MRPSRQRNHEWKEIKFEVSVAKVIFVLSIACFGFNVALVSDLMSQEVKTNTPREMRRRSNKERIDHYSMDYGLIGERVINRELLCEKYGGPADNKALEMVCEYLVGLASGLSFP